MHTYQYTVTNETSGTIKSFWIKHKPDQHSDQDDWGYGTNLEPNAHSPLIEISINAGVPNGGSGPDYTDDVWVVSWTDSDNNLYSTQDYEFVYTVKNVANAPVQISIAEDLVTFEQQDVSTQQFGVHDYGKSYSS